MSEVQSARTGNSRGRGGFRGGRGGYRGGRNGPRTQKDEQDNFTTSLDDQGEVGELKRKFGDKVPLLREVCPGWSDEDLVFALEETSGDVEAAVDRISSGTIAQWGEVKKKQPKSKDAPPPADAASTRGRGRGGFEGRGRGRGAERGARGTSRGARAASQANGTKPSTATQDEWDTAPAAGETQAATTETAGGWDAPSNGDNLAQSDPVAPVEDARSVAPTAAAAKKPGGWAGLFAKPPAPPKAAPVPATESATKAPVTAPTTFTEESSQALLPPIEPQIVEDAPSELPSAPHSEGPSDLPPSKDELTETNLDQLPDESNPPASQTVASTTASTQDPLTQATASKAQIRPVSGYAATALKATNTGGRSASFVRKMKEQQEAVVMPGHHAVEKAAVQFGKMGLNGDGDDAEEDREEPETRTQMPDDSPVAPRASLPPSLSDPQHGAGQMDIQPPTEPHAHRQAPGLPPAPQHAQQQTPQAAPGFGDPYRYGQTGKTYDPFGQPPSTQAPSTSQEAFASQIPGQAQSAQSNQNDMASYYSREAYQQYYGYGQQQDGHRSGGSFGTSAPEAQSQYVTAGPQRGYGQQDAQNSGSNTPAPTMPAQPGQGSQHHQQQQPHMAGQHQGYPYGYPGAYGQQYPQYGQNYMNPHRYGANRPMFDDARRQQQDDYYGNQYAYGQNQHYGGGSYKSNMYGQPQQQYSYEQGSNPANAGSYTGRDNSYGRSGSTQPSEQQGSSSAGFGGLPDPFGRSASGFGQTQSLGQHAGSHHGSEDASKATGPSPALQGGRPGSTTSTSQSQPTGLGQSQSHNSQQGFGAYPQYGGGFGNFGGQQQQQQQQQQGAHQQSSGYGAYGSGAFGAGYGSYGGGGRGWNH